MLLLLFESKKTLHSTALFKAVVLEKITMAKDLDCDYNKINIHDQIGTREKVRIDEEIWIIDVQITEVRLYYICGQSISIFQPGHHNLEGQ